MSGDRYERAGESAANTILRMNKEQKPKVTERDLVTRFLLTIRAYLTGEEVNITYWLDGLKSDGTRVGATVFQPVEVLNDKGEHVRYVPPIFVDPDKILPPDVVAAIPTIMYRYNNLEETLPGRGSDFLRESITKHVNSKEEQVKALEMEWDKLFTDYGLEPVFSNSSEDETVESNDLNEGEFDADFL